MKIHIISFLLLFSLLYADQDPVSGEIFRVVKKPGGNIVSIATNKKSLGQIVDEIAESLGYKIKISREFKAKLDEKKIPVYLEKRELKMVLELLAGSAGGNVEIRKKRIIFFAGEKPGEIKRKISADYKKRLALADIEEKDVAQIYFSMGTFYYLQEKYRQAFDEYDFLLQQFPDNENLSVALLLMSDCLIRTGQHGRARQVLTGFLNKYPRSQYQDRAFIMLAECYRKEARYTESKRIYHYLLNIAGTPRRAEVLYLMGEVCMVQDDYQQASTLFEQAIPELPATSSLKPEALYKYIQCSLELERTGPLYAGIKKFYAEFPKHDLCNKVKLLHVRFTFKKEKYFECHYLLKSMLTCPDIKMRMEAALLDSKSLRQMEMNSEALKMLKKIIASANKSDEQLHPLLYELGDIYLEMKLFSSAKSIFRQLLGHYSDLVYLKIMECDYQARDYSGCLEAFEKYRDRITSKDVLGKAFHLAANCHLNMGEVDKALEAFEGKWRK